MKRRLFLLSPILMIIGCAANSARPSPAQDPTAPSLAEHPQASPVATLPTFNSSVEGGPQTGALPESPATPAVLTFESAINPDSPIAPSQDAMPIADSTPTPDPTKGTVKGVLLVMRGSTKRPVADACLYLAKMLPGSNDAVAAVDRVSSPRTYTDGTGEFVFHNVDPDRYGLVLDTIVNQYLLLAPSDGGPMVIVVEAGKEANLGKLVYDELPV